MVRPEWAPRVVAPSVDLLDEDALLEMLAQHPDSFLNVTRSPQPGQDLQALLAGNRAKLVELRSSGAFVAAADSQPAVHIYRLSKGDHVQTAVVAEVPVSAIATQKVLPHESTRIERARMLANTLSEVRAVSSPVALGFREQPGWYDMVEAATATEAKLDFSAVDDVRQQVWTVVGDAAQALVDSVGEGPLYIIDGHHRSDAAIQHWQIRGTTVEGAHQRLLVAAFPTGELQMAGFNRIARIDEAPKTILDVLRTVGDVTESDAPVEPTEPGTFGVYLDRRWFALVPTPYVPEDPVAALDVSALHRLVLAEGFGVTDARNDPRLDYVPAGVPLTELTGRCDADDAVAFTLASPTIEDLMAVADAGLVMPPKSTYFHPKVRSGVFLVDRFDGDDEA